MKKKIILLAMVMLAMFALCACACDMSEGVLSIPDSLRTIGGILYWRPVNNATGYYVKIDGKTTYVESSSFDLSGLPMGEYYIYVKAIATNYIYSEYSYGFYYEKFLNAPYGFSLIIENDKEVLKWEGDSRATGYSVQFDNEEPIIVNESKVAIEALCDTAILDGGIYNITVKALLAGSFSTESSPYGYIVGTQGLAFTEIYDNTILTGYSVLKGTANTNGAIYIPVYHMNIPVTAVGEYAFSFCTSLKSITIPVTVKSIGYGSFYNCSSLETVTFERSVSDGSLAAVRADAFGSWYVSNNLCSRQQCRSIPNSA